MEPPWNHHGRTWRQWNHCLALSIHSATWGPNFVVERLRARAFARASHRRRGSLTCSWWLRSDPPAPKSEVAGSSVPLPQRIGTYFGSCGIAWQNMQYIAIHYIKGIRIDVKTQLSDWEIWVLKLQLRKIHGISTALRGCMHFIILIFSTLHIMWFTKKTPPIWEWFIPPNLGWFGAWFKHCFNQF